MAVRQLEVPPPSGGPPPARRGGQEAGALDTLLLPAAPPLGRRPEMDLMRAFVVLGVIVLHSALVFSTVGWRVQNAETSVGFDLFAMWGVLWGMPLLFVVSGTAAWHALAKRTAAGFVGERLRRLLVPCVFGFVVLVPPMWYVSRLPMPGFHESYLGFWLRFMDVPAIARGLLTGGRWRSGLDVFDPMHVWFLYILLLLSILLLPVFLYLRGNRGRAAIDPLLSAAERHPFTVLFAGALPFASLALVFGPSSVTGGWSWPCYAVPLTLGYLLASDRRFDGVLLRARWKALLLAVPTTMALMGWAALLGSGVGEAFEGRVPWWAALQAVSGWAWILAILGFASSLGARLVAHRGTGEGDANNGLARAGRYLNEAVLPVYVLHLPVIAGVAFVIVRWSAPMLVKYPVLVVASLTLTLAAYELLVRRVPVMRVLLGMKPASAFKPGASRSPRTRP